VHRLREDSLSTCALDGHLQSVTIPNVVYYNFDLLMMSTTVLETCRGIQKTYKKRICALSWSVAKIILRCTVSKTSKHVLSLDVCEKDTCY